MNLADLILKIREKRRSIKGLKAEEKDWELRAYAPPSLARIKRAVLVRNGIPNATWIETGTFMGETAEFLARNAKEVYTIEPDDVLYAKASLRFNAVPNIKPIHGLSEQVFPKLLPKLSGTINFWLDGHYSGGVTHKGPTDCPVRDELRVIEENLKRFDAITILIDDVRCFNPSNLNYADYPDLDFLVDWARKNRLSWHIEHDIFVAKNSHNNV